MVCFIFSKTHYKTHIETGEEKSCFPCCVGYLINLTLKMNKELGFFHVNEAIKKIKHVVTLVKEVSTNGDERWVLKKQQKHY